MTENSRLFGSRPEADTLQSESESHSDGSVLQKAVNGRNLSLAEAATWQRLSTSIGRFSTSAAIRRDPLIETKTPSPLQPTINRVSAGTVGR
jgi:hypothetical protein